MFILRKIKKYAGKIIRIFHKATYRLIPIDEKLIIFISFHGRGYSDNPRAIYLKTIVSFGLLKIIRKKILVFPVRKLKNILAYLISFICLKLSIG